MELKNESKTLFIPLVAKAIMSKKGLFLNDQKAEEIVDDLNLNVKQSKWLSMFLALRASLIDGLCEKYLSDNKNISVIHLGCGLDSRYKRVNGYKKWYDVDYKEVIDLRKKYFKNTEDYEMIKSSVLNFNWLNKIDSNRVLIIMEGLLMYLSENEIKELVNQLESKFNNIYFIFDSYTKKGVKLSKIKNPINKYDAIIKYGFDNKNEFLKLNKKLKYIDSYAIRNYNNNLSGFTKFIFDKIYCGKISESIYKIYEFELKKKV